MLFYCKILYCCGFQDDSQCVYLGRRSSSENTSTPHRGDPQLYQTSTRGRPPKSTKHTHHFIFKNSLMLRLFHRLNVIE